jgi:hypothetical protein
MRLGTGWCPRFTRYPLPVRDSAERLWDCGFGITPAPACHPPASATLAGQLEYRHTWQWRAGAIVRPVRQPACHCKTPAGRDLGCILFRIKLNWLREDLWVDLSLQGSSIHPLGAIAFALAQNFGR